MADPIPAAAADGEAPRPDPTPILAGMASLVWTAIPSLTNVQLAEVVRLLDSALAGERQRAERLREALDDTESALSAAGRCMRSLVEGAPKGDTTSIVIYREGVNWAARVLVNVDKAGAAARAALETP